MKDITFSSDSKLTWKDHHALVVLIDKYFRSQEDPEQMSTSKENIRWVHKNIPECTNVIKYKDKVIGSTFIIPCNKRLMDLFIFKKMTERAMFEKIKKSINYKNFNTIYLCSAFIIPKFRHKGLPTTGFLKSIKRITEKRKIKPTLFYWSYSKEGNFLAKNTAKITKLKLLKRI